MKTNYFLPVSFLLTLFGVTTAVFSAPVPEQLIYEGRIVMQNGTIPADEYTMRFSFWDNGDYTPAVLNADGTLNTSLGGYTGWTETHSVDFNTLGHFSTILGNQQSLIDLHFDTYKFLQVEIKKTAEADTEYKLLDINGDNGADANDRKTVASVPYARHADSSSGANVETFIIDAENIIETAGTGQISLQFGGTLAEFLHYDFDLQRFIFTDDLQVNGDLFVSSSTGSVQISADNITSDITLTLPDEDTTVVGETNTQTLTNKTIDASLNTLTNIDRSSLLAFPQNLQIFPQYSGMVFVADGPNDNVSVYMGKDGETPYYKVSSQEATLQSGIFTVSVGLPEGYEDFTNGKAVLHYKTQTGNTSENAVSISIEDQNGTVEASQTSAVSSGAWSTIDLPLTAAFAPVNDIVVLKIQTDATNVGTVHLGAIELHFEGK